MKNRLHTAVYSLIAALAATLALNCSSDRSTSQVGPTPDDTPTGRWDTNFVRDYAYAEGRIFDLAYPDEIGPYDSVRVWLYEEETHYDNPEAVECVLDVDIGHPTPLPSGDNPRHLLMKEITGDEGWELLYGQDTARCPVAIVFYAHKRRALGVRIEIARYSADGTPTGVDTIGYRGAGSELDTLRVLMPFMSNMMPSNPAWSLMWRNCYRIPKNYSTDDLEVLIRKGLPWHERSPECLAYQMADSVAQDPYIKILGLDQWNNNSGQRIPDDRIDNRAEVFRSDWGLLIFPERQPFNSRRTFVDGNGARSDSLLVKVPSLYAYNSAVEKLENSTYFLEIRVWEPYHPFVY